jgi:hypothetical protein
LMELEERRRVDFRIWAKFTWRNFDCLPFTPL